MKTLIENKSYEVEELEKTYDTEIANLVAEYKEDPNCWASLWVNDTNLTGIRRASFIYHCNKK